MECYVTCYVTRYVACELFLFLWLLLFLFLVSAFGHKYRKVSNDFIISDFIICKVPGQGFEPRFHAPEACVLPLDDPGTLHTIIESLYL